MNQTAVVVTPDSAQDSAYMQAIDAASRRLIVYRDAFITAFRDDAGPLPLPVRWHRDDARD